MSAWMVGAQSLKREVRIPEMRLGVVRVSFVALVTTPNSTCTSLQRGEKSAKIGFSGAVKCVDLSDITMLQLPRLVIEGKTVNVCRYFQYGHSATLQICSSKRLSHYVNKKTFGQHCILKKYIFAVANEQCLHFQKTRLAGFTNSIQQFQFQVKFYLYNPKSQIASGSFTVCQSTNDTLCPQISIPWLLFFLIGCQIQHVFFNIYKLPYLLNVVQLYPNINDTGTCQAQFIFRWCCSDINGTF